MSLTLLAPSFVSVLVVAGCSASSRPDSRASDSTVLAQRAARVERALATSDSGQGASKPIARWILPKQLTEISGLAVTPDGRLLAHNDETARIFEIDYRRGVIGKHFSLGTQPVHGDFEGIAVANETIYLLASNGKLYEFREGADGARVSFTVYNTQLGSECEFEGVAFEAASNSLLLACKIVGKKHKASNLVIYRWKREGHATGVALDVPLSRVIGSNGWKGLHPSDLSIDPASGNYVIVSAQEEALVELTPAGEVVSARPLPKGHAHTEGVAVTKDGILIISDEAGRQSASITLYRKR